MPEGHYLPVCEQKQKHVASPTATKRATREVWRALVINNTLNRQHVIIIIIMYLPIKIGIYSNGSTNVIFLTCDSLKKLSYLRG